MPGSSGKVVDGEECPLVNIRVNGLGFPAWRDPHSFGCVSPPKRGKPPPSHFFWAGMFAFVLQCRPRVAEVSARFVYLGCSDSLSAGGVVVEGVVVVSLHVS